MATVNDRWYRIGTAWMFDTQERIGYKVTDRNPVIIQRGKLVEIKEPEAYATELAKASRSRRVTRVQDPDKLDVEKAFKLGRNGDCKKLIPVPVGVVRKAEEILKRQSV